MVRPKIGRRGLSCGSVGLGTRCRGRSSPRPLGKLPTRGDDPLLQRVGIASEALRLGDPFNEVLGAWAGNGGPPTVYAEGDPAAAAVVLHNVNRLAPSQRLPRDPHVATSAAALAPGALEPPPLRDVERTDRTHELARTRSSPCLDGILERAKVINLDANEVARTQPLWGVHVGARTGRRTRGQHVARLERKY